MSIEAVIGMLTLSGASALGAVFLLKTFVQTGIQKSVELNFSKHLESYKVTLSKELESLKSSLKNSEVFFVRQLEALTALRSIFRKFIPKPSSPDMDWHEACQEIANSFSIHDRSIHEYLCIYDAVLPDSVRSHLETANRIARDGTFECEWNTSTDDAEPTKLAIKSAERLYETLEISIKEFQSIIEEKIGSKKITTRSSVDGLQPRP